ncbi:MAG TPA: hypothetical protein VKB25_12965 [Conexibacter sp.]|nr:hypothetical protein [Conexibacter sp.]
MESSTSGVGGTGPNGGSPKRRGGQMSTAIVLLTISVMLATLVIDRLAR